MRTIILVSKLTLVLIHNSILCAPECLAFTRNLQQIDYKTPHPVGQDGGCTCPCQKLYPILQRGECKQCRHFRIVTPMHTTYYTTPVRSLNIQNLVKDHIRKLLTR